MGESFFDSVLNWLHQGYPQGVPQKDYFALLALLKRTLSEEDVVKAAQTLLRDGDRPITTEQIHQTIHEITGQEPNPEEIRQVAARLASVGWPLAAAAG
jgi:hypothetical protein